MDERRAARMVTTGIGLTCLVSAIWLASSPRRATRTLQLPASARLGRFLAARDLTVGAMLLVPSLQSRALAARATCDAFDAALMTRTLVRGERPARTGLFIVGALTLSGLSWALHDVLQEAPRRP